MIIVRVFIIQNLDSQDTSVAQPHLSSAVALAQAASGKSDAVDYIV
jgi:hypothetical protein